jgi:hypothetical protein
MSYVINKESFLKDVVNHQIQIIRDDGVNRHIRLARPDTSCMHFDLITWPGHLCYTGDMGTYVFTRLVDMFAFFRRSELEKKYSIDRRYWAEKCIAKDRDGIEQFDEEIFNKTVKRITIEWVRENSYRTTKEERRDLWDEVISDVIDADGDSGGYRKQIAAHEFYHEVNADLGFSFYDLFEHSFTDYTHRFTWCCFAIAWGIEQYDIVKSEALRG